MVNAVFLLAFRKLSRNDFDERQIQEEVAPNARSWSQRGQS